MIYNIDGDLLKSDCTVIMHQANCFSTMGAGIARSIADKYPMAEQADRTFPLPPKDRLGRYSYIETDDKTTVVNLYGQYNMGAGLQTNYHMLEKSIETLFLDAQRGLISIDLSKVGLPYKMGCGLAGGDWEIVLGIVKRLSNKYMIDIFIYKL